MSDSKIVNLIWLGNKPIYDKYINNTKSKLAGWDVKVWTDEDIKDINCKYFKIKMLLKQYAFASDYLRFKILYDNGGLYVDCDVEFLKGIDDLIEKGSFLGTEFISNRVSSGVIMYFDKPHHPVLKKILDYYEKNSYIPYICDGEVLKNSILEYGYEPVDKTQYLDDITIYDSSYFCPNTMEDSYLNVKENTRAVHHYTGLWRK